jgi:hypothetical protein
MSKNALRLIVFALVGITITAAVQSCTTRTHMRVSTNRYFDPEEGRYPSLDDTIFGPKMRISGVLSPRKFADIFGFWIFLTEPHKQKRIPVLLVHGHWTGPPVFKKLAASLDKTRFEPWFTYYPSGLSLPESASMLRINLSRLSAYYGNKEVAVAAYSLGGLVVRQALRPANDGVVMPKIPMLIGIANPWGGSIKTRAGTKFSFAGKEGSRLAVAESWEEFVDQTPFINALFDDPMPKETEFHMMYGVGGNDDFLEGRDDGALPESSLGRKEAVAEADSVTIFEDLVHADIIYADKTMAKVNELLGTLR